MEDWKKVMGIYCPQPLHPATARSMPIKNFFLPVQTRFN